MEAKMQKVSAFEAKTRLSELLRETEQGATFVICRRGKEVAQLGPPAKGERKMSFKKLSSSFREVRSRIHGKIDIRELIEEGRRY
ncbi:MAG: type II toxin-antitoxin system Phd/YefM family antitoxin [Deltaproteobacteria bacterium]|nr:type II toxin-antitoxin system Phd/YefM family antitoxin [Deltaproteobacteria bacterium]